ncbi:MAG: gamma-glutamylcyclotransferase [Parvibaculum sp.]|nr:gamma-glutamylcyclotransferase [Parvibaculum sp.]
MQDLWVFGYGSLMWRPGFDYAERRLARLHGYHRSFCVYSHVHRGTPERPGLVFGLDAGGSCRGVAFRVDAAKAETTRAYLQEREQVTAVYVERMASVVLTDSVQRVEALCFVVDRTHQQYAGALDFDRQVDLIVHGVGKSGRNPEYLQSTIEHLDEMKIADSELTKLWNAVEVRLHQSELSR